MLLSQGRGTGFAMGRSCEVTRPLLMAWGSNVSADLVRACAFPTRLRAHLRCTCCGKIAGKLRETLWCRNHTSQSLKEQLLCTGDTQGTSKHPRGTTKRAIAEKLRAIEKLRKIAELNPLPRVLGQPHQPFHICLSPKHRSTPSHLQDYGWQRASDFLGGNGLHGKW